MLLQMGKGAIRRDKRRKSDLASFVGLGSQHADQGDSGTKVFQS